MLALQIKQAESRQQEIKLSLEGQVPQGQRVVFDGIQVEWVKGRESSKLDRAKLVLAGVTKEQIDSATVSSTGKPHLRIGSVSDNG